MDFRRYIVCKPIIECTRSLAAAILDLPLSVTSDSIYSINDKSSGLNDLDSIGVVIGILIIYSLENEIHEPALNANH